MVAEGTLRYRLKKNLPTDVRAGRKSYLTDAEAKQVVGQVTLLTMQSFPVDRHLLAHAVRLHRCAKPL